MQDEKPRFVANTIYPIANMGTILAKDASIFNKPVGSKPLQG
jgi:hypothetical protein